MQAQDVDESEDDEEYDNGEGDEDEEEGDEDYDQYYQDDDGNFVDKIGDEDDYGEDEIQVAKNASIQSKEQAKAVVNSKSPAQQNHNRINSQDAKAKAPASIDKREEKLIKNRQPSAEQNDVLRQQNQRQEQQR